MIAIFIAKNICRVSTSLIIEKMPTLCPTCRKYHLNPNQAEMANSSSRSQADSEELLILHEGISLQKRLPQSFMDEWKKHPEFTGKYVDFMKYMAQTGTGGDVKFIVKKGAFGDDDDEGDASVEIKAHKLLLRSKSEFFSTLFSDRWVQEEIDLTGSAIREKEFRAFLQYLYVGQVPLTKDNLMPLYHLSSLYQISDLQTKCEDFMTGCIDDENVFTLFNAVFACDFAKKSELLDKIIGYICEKGETMLERVEFMEFDQSKLALIFSRKKMNCGPLKLLRFCLRWAKRAKGETFLRSGDLKTLIMNGLEVRKHFWTDFSFFLFPSREELKNDPNRVFEFRRLEVPQELEPRKWVYRRNRADRISFRTSESIYLTGIGLFGDRKCTRHLQYADKFEPARYDVDIKIYVHGKEHREILNIYRRAGSDMKFDSKIFAVQIDPCYLPSDEWYTIAVVMGGPPSYSGAHGCTGSLMKCGNIPMVIEFKDASIHDENAKLSNASGVTIGQIPELHFKLASSYEEEDVQIVEDSEDYSPLA